MVGYNGEKMSKSLGNLVLVSDALKSYSADAIRLYLFSHHYRETWVYEEVELDRWARVADDLIEAVEIPAYGIEDELDVSTLRDRFFTALDDDLNTPSPSRRCRRSPPPSSNRRKRTTSATRSGPCAS